MSLSKPSSHACSELRRMRTYEVDCHAGPIGFSEDKEPKSTSGMQPWAVSTPAFHLITETVGRWVNAGNDLPHSLAIIADWLVEEFPAACALYMELMYPRSAVVREEGEFGGVPSLRSGLRENARPAGTPHAGRSCRRPRVHGWERQGAAGAGADAAYPTGAWPSAFWTGQRLEQKVSADLVRLDQRRRGTFAGKNAEDKRQVSRPDRTRQA
jgi:hypothetical protein